MKHYASQNPLINAGLIPFLLRVLLEDSPFGVSVGVPWLKQTSLSKEPSSQRSSPHPMPDQHGVGRSCHNLRLWPAVQLQCSHWQAGILPWNYHPCTDGIRHGGRPLRSTEARVGAASQLHFSLCSILLLSPPFQRWRSQESSFINALHANLCLFSGNPICKKLLINPTKWMTLKTILLSEKKGHKRVYFMILLIRVLGLDELMGGERN